MVDFGMRYMWRVRESFFRMYFGGLWFWRGLGRESSWTTHTLELKSERRGEERSDDVRV